jgi:hypothetical protein
MVLLLPLPILIPTASLALPICNTTACSLKEVPVIKASLPVADRPKLKHSLHVAQFLVIYKRKKSDPVGISLLGKQ